VYNLGPTRAQRSPPNPPVLQTRIFFVRCPPPQLRFPVTVHCAVRACHRAAFFHPIHRLSSNPGGGPSWAGAFMGSSLSFLCTGPAADRWRSRPDAGTLAPGEILPHVPANHSNSR